MNCNEVTYLLPDYLRGELSDVEKSSVAAHLRECKDCPQELASLQQLYSHLEAAEIAEPSQAYWANLLPRIHERIGEKPYAPRWIPRYAFPLAFVVIVLVVASLFLPPDTAEKGLSNGVWQVVEEMSEEEIEQVRENSFALNGYTSLNGIDNRLAGDKEVLETVLGNEENLFSYSEIDAASLSIVMDDQEVELLVAHLDQKRFVRK